MPGALFGTVGGGLGAINGMAGSMMSGVGGMMTASLLGGNNGLGASGSGRSGSVGGGGGNALADIIQAGRAGAQMGNNFGGGKITLTHLKNIPMAVANTVGIRNQLAPVFDPKTEQAVYERDANNE